MVEVSRKHLAILGSTGSIGRQALELVKAHPELYSLELLTGGNNADLLISQAREFLPGVVIIANKNHYQHVRASLKDLPIKVFAGEEAIAQIMESASFGVVLNALTGISGLAATVTAIKNKKTVALANKEVMVAAGHLVTALSESHGVDVLPVDSEHSAIFQCLTGEWMNPIEKIYLTASGGPFLGQQAESLKKVTREEALRHPRWEMGNKISIDSATLMNKGLEVIEAKWFFGLRASQIDVIVHPQSVIHSIVQFEDGSMKAQMGLPDMRIPIQYALNYPKRIPSRFSRFVFADHPFLSFELPDRINFPCLEMAYSALRSGGNHPCVLNASNEMAVELFLDGKINLTQIPDIIGHCMSTAPFIDHPDFDQVLGTHAHTREMAYQYSLSLTS